MRRLVVLGLGLLGASARTAGIAQAGPFSVAGRADPIPLAIPFGAAC